MDCGRAQGYTAGERRAIEGSLFSGGLRGVAATNALELGIDIGALDVTVHLGFPGTVASLLQQAGRAGRREQMALSVYVAFDSALDQLFMRAPRRLFDRPLEAACVDARNAKAVSQARAPARARRSGSMSPRPCLPPRAAPARSTRAARRRSFRC